MRDLLKPIKGVQVVDRELLTANDYNPNKVNENNLELLVQSILSNGWTMPIVVRPDYTIIDGYHRWLVSGREPLLSKLGGKVPVAIVEHQEESDNIYGTITHNRARGTHLLDPMRKIVNDLISQGKSVKDIKKQLGMSEEEIYKLSNFSREDFLKIMTEGSEGGYSRARYIVKM